MSEASLSLVADLGGTNVRFALADPDAERPLCDASIRRFRVADFTSLAEAAQTYLDTVGARPRHGVFAVAGRVEGDTARLTNHPWQVVNGPTRTRLGLRRLDLINDFAALSLALPLLQDLDLEVIGSPPMPTLDPDHGHTCVVLGPGTGLGVGALLCRDGRYLPLASEGGHIGFAPVEAEEIELLRCLSARYGRVSIERLVSGPGLSNLHQAVAEIAGVHVPTLAPETITDRAVDGQDPLCLRAVELCADLLARLAGDLVLTLGAWDGAYLAGGLTRQLAPWLHSDRFRQRFQDKGRFSIQMSRVPMAAIVHPEPGLLGSAAQASLSSGRSLHACRH